MIKLTDLSYTPPHVHTFETGPILIGSKQPSNSDSAYLCLSDGSLQENHLQIILQNIAGSREYLVVNLARDPFATLNKLPFGKQPLKNGDLIQVGSKILQVTIELEQKKSLKELLDKEKVSGLEANEFHTLMKQVEEMSDPIGIPPLEKTVPALSSSPAKKQQTLKNSPSTQLSLKDYYLNESDEEQEIHLQPPEEMSKDIEPKHNPPWKAFLRLLIVGGSLFLAIFTTLYVLVDKQTAKEELLASKGAADVAMALTYTQMKHIRPQNQNWSDPEFIKNNLTAVLASSYQAFADFDSHGQFLQCPYMLRIYTNSEISRFLVLAQPSPSLLQWLVPKGTIIIDSSTMEMRRITDLRSLNRLLVNNNMLDGAHAEEITALVQKGERIPLSSLVDHQKENEGFIPPKALGFIDPAGENLIYNAPRYYCLGENLIKRSEELLNDNEGEEDAALLIQEIFALKKLSHLVLYSSGGVLSAIEAQKTLSTLAPKEKFLFAYLHLNSTGKIASSHILMDETIAEKALKGEIGSPLLSLNDAVNDPLFQEKGSGVNENTEKGENPVASNSRSDPLINKLSEITSLHQNTLQSVCNEMILLLKKQVKSSQHNFASEFLILQQKIFERIDELKADSLQKFKSLLEEYYLIPAANFVEMVKEADLEMEFEEFLNTLRNQKSYLESELTERQILEGLQNIQSSGNWQEMEYSTDYAIKLLQFEHVPYIEPLVHYQQAMKVAVMDKLNEFFYSSHRALPDVQYLKHNRESLVRILQNAWIDDFTTAETYLNEFDKRAINIREIED